jgi:hypothetical protein
MIDGGLLHDASHIKLDVVSTMQIITETWNLVTPTTTKNCLQSVVFRLIMSAATMIKHQNLLEMKKMTGIICNFLEYTLRTRQKVRVLPRFVEFTLLIKCCTICWPDQKKNHKRKKRKWQKIRQHFWMHGNTRSDQKLHAAIWHWGHVQQTIQLRAKKKLIDWLNK